MTAVDHKLDALSGRIPDHSLVDAGCLPGPCSCLCSLESDKIADHRAVQPVGQQAPALVGRHSEYRLLGGQLDCERLLRKFLCRVATESDAAVGGHHIHASVSVVDGHLVVLDPVGVLAADHEVHELVQQCAADVGVSDV